MDLALYLRVVWRFRLLVALGLVVALSLTFLSYARVSFDGATPTITYRDQEVWQTETSILVTQPGFPEGRSLGTAEPEAGSQFADPRRFLELAVLYAALANSDAVQELMRRDGPLPGAVSARPYVDSQDRALPLVILSAVGRTPADAKLTARRGATALVSFLQQRQDRAAVPARDRVSFEIVEQPNTAVLASGRSLKGPLLVFFAVMIAVLGLAFLLENLRPRVRPVPSVGDLSPLAETRRTGTR